MAQKRAHLLIVILSLIFLSFALIIPKFREINLTSYDDYDSIQQEPKQQRRQQQQTSPRKGTTTVRRKWAYVFMIGSCDPEKQIEYRGYFYGVLIASHMLRKGGSKADMVLMVEISYSSKAVALSNEEERLLNASGVKIQYLPKPTSNETFYSVNMAKFNLLRMTEYSRIFFLDADVMPLCSLDYYFDLSEPMEGQNGDRSNGKTSEPWLKENMVISESLSPSNGGAFILSPQPGDWELSQSIIREHQERMFRMPNPTFDPEYGWGHKFDLPDDYWLDWSGNRGGNWTWWAVASDQGFLYYWVKYVKKSVSILINGTVENWVADDSSPSTVRLESMLDLPFQNHTCQSSTLPSDLIETSKGFGELPFMDLLDVPHTDYVHFLGICKPWKKEAASNRGCKSLRLQRQIPFWFHVLGEVKKELNMTYLNLEKIQVGAPSAGRNVTVESAVEAARINLATGK